VSWRSVSIRAVIAVVIAADRLVGAGSRLRICSRLQRRPAGFKGPSLTQISQPKIGSSQVKQGKSREQRQGREQRHDREQRY
jgi:hypothetical protein